jgi:CRISPR-associated protein Cas5
MKYDLNFLLEKPDFSIKAKLTIDALAPLSMVTSMPGKYYRSQPEPTDEMLYGLLENALGWHISTKERTELLKRLKKQHKQEPYESGVGYASLLQFHLRFTTSLIPPLKHYDDLWSQHLKGGSFLGGSRNYDYRCIPIMNAEKEKRVAISDGSETKGFSKDPEKLTDFKDGDKINVNVVRPYFPQYYASPTPREYVVPEGAYKFIIETSAILAQLLAEAIENPTAPLYLGSNDGWVEVEWEVVQ